jgi:hypothetical protein
LLSTLIREKEAVMNPDDPKPMNTNDEVVKADQQQEEILKDRAERERTFSRRALLEAGWSIPVVVALQLPQSALQAQYHADRAPFQDHQDQFDDGPFNDGPFNDGPFNDGPPHTDHTDVPIDLHDDTN